MGAVRARRRAAGRAAMSPPARSTSAGSARASSTRLGVKSFQALTAPMLIDSYALENAVIESGVTEEMMEGLDELGVAGLGVLADGSAPADRASTRPILGPADWRGISFGTSEVERPGRGDPSARRRCRCEIFGQQRAGRPSITARSRDLSSDSRCTTDPAAGRLALPTWPPTCTSGPRWMSCSRTRTSATR